MFIRYKVNLGNKDFELIVSEKRGTKSLVGSWNTKW